MENCEVRKKENSVDIIERLNEDIRDDSINKNVCIFGQGFVGLPLALSFAFRGCNTTGVDLDEKLISAINNGLTHHTESYKGISIEEILNIELKNGRYIATNKGEDAVKNCNNIIVTVGIPIKNGVYELSYLESACKTIGKNLKKGDLVIIRSTVIPGTTEDFILPILQKESGMKAGKDFYLAYSSERIAESRAFDEFADMPTLVGAVNEKSLKRAVDLLKIVCKSEIVEASCIKVVETSKVIENVQRDVNIAMVQEFARFTEALGIDIFEVIKLANTHKRVNLLTPGPGVGGYCIPNAYYYLKPKAEELAVELPLLKLAREENSLMPKFIVNKIQQILLEEGKEIKDVKVAVFGLAMKDNSNDDRISPPVEICRMLIEKGAEVRAYDPLITTKYDFKVETQEEAYIDADVVVILAKQQEMNYDDLKYMSELIKKRAICIDTKAVINLEEAKKYGFKCWRI